MKTPRPTSKTADIVAALQVDPNRSASELARTFGVTHSHITYVRKAYNLRRTVRHKDAPGAIDAAAIKKILALRRAKIPLNMIAAHVGVSDTSIDRVVRKYGLAKKNVTLPAGADKLICLFKSKGLGPKAIAQKTGFKIATIKRVLKAARDEQQET